MVELTQIFKYKMQCKCTSISRAKLLNTVIFYIFSMQLPMIVFSQSSLTSLYIGSCNTQLVFQRTKIQNNTYTSLLSGFRSLLENSLRMMRKFKLGGRPFPSIPAAPWKANSIPSLSTGVRKKQKQKGYLQHGHPSNRRLRDNMQLAHTCVSQLLILDFSPGPSQMSKKSAGQAL